jgi:hypothetical protein
MWCSEVLTIGLNILAPGIACAGSKHAGGHPGVKAPGFQARLGAAVWEITSGVFRKSGPRKPPYL